jgi:hypothetical protein
MSHLAHIAGYSDRTGIAACGAFVRPCVMKSGKRFS